MYVASILIAALRVRRLQQLLLHQQLLLVRLLLAPYRHEAARGCVSCGRGSITIITLTHKS